MTRIPRKLRKAFKESKDTPIQETFEIYEVDRERLIEDLNIPLETKIEALKKEILHGDVFIVKYEDGSYKTVGLWEDVSKDE